MLSHWPLRHRTHRRTSVLRLLPLLLRLHRLAPRRHHKNCLRNHAQPLKSSFLVESLVHQRPPMHPPSLSRRTYPFSSQKSARLGGQSCIMAWSRARGLWRTWRCWRTRSPCGCRSICCLGARRRLLLLKIQFALLSGEESLPELVNPNQTKL